jgi:hypothetical protein
MVKTRRRIRQKIRLPVFFDPKIKSQPGFCLIESSINFHLTYSSSRFLLQWLFGCWLMLTDFWHFVSFFKSNYSTCAMTTCRELSGASGVLQPRTMGPLFKLLTTVLLISSTQGQVVELNKNQGIMLPNQPYQMVNATRNITITCVFIHTAEIQWTLPTLTKLSTDTVVWKFVLTKSIRKPFF